MMEGLRAVIKDWNRFAETYVKGFSWSMVEQALKLVVGVTLSVLVIKFLGPEDYGLLAYALSLTTVISPVATLGIDSILYRDVIRKKCDEKVLLHTAKTLKIASSSVLAIIVLVILLIVKNDPTLNFIVGIMMLGVIFNSLNVYKESLFAKSKVQLVALSGIFSIFVSSGFKLVLMYVNAGILWFALAFTSANLANVVALRFFYKRTSELEPHYFSNEIAIRLLKDSWPLIFASFSGTLFLFVDQISIEYYLDYKEVGIYSAAIKLVLVFTVIPSVIANIIYPKIIQHHEKEPRVVFKLWLEKIYFYHLLIPGIFISLILIIGEHVVKILYGENFVAGGVVLKIYSFTLIFAFLNPLNNKLLMIDNSQRKLLARNVVGLVFNIALNILFIPQFGLPGAAVATVLAQLILTFSYCLDSKTRYIAFLPIKSLFYPLRNRKKIS